MSTIDPTAARLSDLTAQRDAALEELEKWQSGPITEEMLRQRDRSIHVGIGCEIAVAGTTKKLAELERSILDLSHPNIADALRLRDEAKAESAANAALVDKLGLVLRELKRWTDDYCDRGTADDPWTSPELELARDKASEALHAKPSAVLQSFTLKAFETLSHAWVDPGAFTPRGDNYGEAIGAWQARAQTIALASIGITTPQP